MASLQTVFPIKESLYIKLPLVVVYLEGACDNIKRILMLIRMPWNLTLTQTNCLVRNVHCMFASRNVCTWLPNIRLQPDRWGGNLSFKYVFIKYVTVQGVCALIRKVTSIAFVFYGGKLSYPAILASFFSDVE